MNKLHGIHLKRVIRLSFVYSAFLAVTLIATAPFARAASYQFDPTHTFATFEIRHFATSTTRGRFDKKEGKLEFDREAKTGKIEMDIFTGSINTGVPFFDKFLTGFTLFDSATFPTAKFVSDNFKFVDNKVTAVDGIFTLLGVSQPVTLKATNFNCYNSALFRREVCGGDFETTLDRTQFGLNYGLIFGFPKEVRLLIQVEAIKQ